MVYAVFAFSGSIVQPLGEKVFMGIILPSKRVFGMSLKTMTGSTFGSAISPVIFGIIVDYINPTSDEVIFFIYLFH